MAGMDSWRTAVRYRNHAELLRSIAEETKDEGQKTALQSAAQYYEALAEKLEQEAREPRTE